MFCPMRALLNAREVAPEAMTLTNFRKSLDSLSSDIVAHSGQLPVNTHHSGQLPVNTHTTPLSLSRVGNKEAKQFRVFVVGARDQLAAAGPKYAMTSRCVRMPQRNWQHTLPATAAHAYSDLEDRPPPSVNPSQFPSTCSAPRCVRRSSLSVACEVYIQPRF